MGKNEEEEQSTPLDDIQHGMEDLPEGGTFDQDDRMLDTADEGTSTTEQQEDTDWESKYAEAEKSASGRLAEIGNLRTQLRDTSGNIETLRQLVMDQRQKQGVDQAKEAQEDAKQRDIERYGENVVNDPHVAYMRDGMSQLQYQLERDRQVNEGRMRAVQEQAAQRRAMEEQRTVMLQNLDAQEQEFAKEHEDYDDAYEFARGKRKEMYARRGYDDLQAEQRVSEEEVYLAQEQLLRGGNVAREIYQWAIDYGWEGVSPEKEGKTSARRGSQQADQGVSNEEAGGLRSDFDRIRRGISNASLRQFDSQAVKTSDDYISAEQFYKTVPEHIRAQVHADPDMFEQLGRYGKIKIFW